jgi:hypothetical protein
MGGVARLFGSDSCPAHVRDCNVDKLPQPVILRLGNFYVLFGHIMECFELYPASGLTTSDMNPSNKTSQTGAIHKISRGVRDWIRARPGGQGTAAWLDVASWYWKAVNDDRIAPLQRISLVFRVYLFIVGWQAWAQALELPWKIVGCTSELVRHTYLALANMMHLGIFHKIWARDTALCAWKHNSYWLEKRFSLYRYLSNCRNPDLIASDYAYDSPKVRRNQHRRRFADMRDGQLISATHLTKPEDFPHLRNHEWTVHHLMDSFKAQLHVVRGMFSLLGIDVALFADHALFVDANYVTPGESGGGPPPANDAGGDEPIPMPFDARPHDEPADAGSDSEFDEMDHKHPNDDDGEPVRTRTCDGSDSGDDDHPSDDSDDNDDIEVTPAQLLASTIARLSVVIPDIDDVVDIPAVPDDIVAEVDPVHDWNDWRQFRSEDDEPGFSSTDNPRRSTRQGKVYLDLNRLVARGTCVRLLDNSVMNAQQYVKFLGGGVGRATSRGTAVAKFIDTDTADVDNACCLRYGQHFLYPFDDGSVQLCKPEGFKVKAGNAYKYEHGVTSTDLAFFISATWYVCTDDSPTLQRFVPDDAKYTEIWYPVDLARPVNAQVAADGHSVTVQPSDLHLLADMRKASLFQHDPSAHCEEEIKEVAVSNSRKSKARITRERTTHMAVGAPDSPEVVPRPKKRTKNHSRVPPPPPHTHIHTHTHPRTSYTHTRAITTLQSHSLLTSRL